MRETEADAVIVGMNDSEEPGLTSRLLDEYPDLTILGVAIDANSAFLRPRRIETVDASEQSILDALRHAIRATHISEKGL